jgi:hypothetical protein
MEKSLLLFFKSSQKASGAQKKKKNMEAIFQLGKTKENFTFELHCNHFSERFLHGLPGRVQAVRFSERKFRNFGQN